MALYDFDMLVIGGGAAGLTIASGCARFGLKTVLIEQEPNLGGDCLHYGCVPSKTLLRSAAVAHTIKKTKFFGLPPVDFPPTDFAQIRRRIQSVQAIIQKHDSVERFCGLGVDVRFGQARFVDEHTMEIDGKKITSKFIALATGSSPLIPDIPGIKSTSVITHREIFSLDQLPARLVILGGGPIAVEMGMAFHRLGSEVHILQRGPHILSNEDQDMADIIGQCLLNEGLHIHCGTTVLSVNMSDAGREIHAQDKSGQRTILQADQILVAMGRSANVHGLNLEGINIQISSKGIETGPDLRTTHRHIFAAGDVLGKHQFTHAAGYEGGIVVGNAVFRLSRRADYRFMPHCTYTDPELAGMGLSEKQAKAQGIDFTVWTEMFSGNDRAQTEGATEGKIKLLLDKKERPIGVHIVSARAGEILNSWVTVFSGGVKLSSLASAVHPYPTLGEINKRITGNLLAKKIFSPFVLAMLRRLFGYRGRAC